MGTLSLSALTLAGTPNNDNPELTPISQPNKPKPTPVVVQPKPKPEVPTTGHGFKNFTNTCKTGSYTFDTSSYKLSAQCRKYDKSYKKSTVDLNSCFNADSNENLEPRGFLGNYLKTDCKNCTVNLKTLFITCVCAGNTTSRNLNINIANTNGQLGC